MDQRLKRKIAVVAGAGLGIGRACAMVMAEEGALVAVVTRKEEAGQETVTRIHARDGKAMAFTADLTDYEQAEACFEKILKACGKIDILNCNLGGYHTSGPEGMTESVWEELFETNLKSVFMSARACIPHMVKNGAGSIVFTSAACSAQTDAGAAERAESIKSGIISLTKSLAEELAPHNIRVNCVLPGSTGKELYTQGRMLMGTEPKLSRQGYPEDTAFAVLYFASDESAWVTGSAFAVDGAAAFL